MKRHNTDILSLGAGALFLILAIVYGTSANGSAPDMRIALPVVLVVLGGAGMASAILAQRRSDEATNHLEASDD